MLACQKKLGQAGPDLWPRPGLGISMGIKNPRFESGFSWDSPGLGLGIRTGSENPGVGVRARGHRDSSP